MGEREAGLVEEEQRQESILEYHRFLLRLRADLGTAEALLKKREEEYDSAAALIQDLTNIQKEGQKQLSVLKDVGCGVHMHAEIPDTSRIFVSVGLGFFAEATLEEACSITQDRAHTLKAQLDGSMQQVADIQAHVQLIQEGIAGLQQLESA